MGADSMLLLALVTATCLAEDAGGAGRAEDDRAEGGGRSEWEEAQFTTEEAAPVSFSASARCPSCPRRMRGGAGLGGPSGA
jgi:hypothetical protein